MPGTVTGPMLKDKNFIISPAATVFGMRLVPGIVIRPIAVLGETRGLLYWKAHFLADPG